MPGNFIENKKTEVQVISFGLFPATLNTWLDSIDLDDFFNNCNTYFLLKEEIKSKIGPEPDFSMYLDESNINWVIDNGLYKQKFMSLKNYEYIKKEIIHYKDNISFYVWDWDFYYKRSIRKSIFTSVPLFLQSIISEDDVFEIQHRPTKNNRFHNISDTIVPKSFVKLPNISFEDDLTFISDMLIAEYHGFKVNHFLKERLSDSSVNSEYLIENILNICRFPSIDLYTQSPKYVEIKFSNFYRAMFKDVLPVPIKQINDFFKQHLSIDNR